MQSDSTEQIVERNEADNRFKESSYWSDRKGYLVYLHQRDREQDMFKVLMESF